MRICVLIIHITHTKKNNWEIGKISELLHRFKSKSNYMLIAYFLILNLVSVLFTDFYWRYSIPSSAAEIRPTICFKNQLVNFLNKSRKIVFRPVG